VLTAGLDAAADGSGQLVLLEGEPGIGKTHLARAVAEEARTRGFAVLWGRCWEEGGAPAYWPWTQVLRTVLRRRPADGLPLPDSGTLRRLLPIVPDAAALLPPDDAADDGAPGQFALFDAVAMFLHDAVADQPSVLLLDDLHAADQDSLRLLAFIARDLPHTRLAVVGTYRGDDAARVGADVLLARLAREGRVLPLRGLTESQVGMLVRRVAGEPAGADVVRSVHRASRGNPLYVDSITQLLVAEERLQLAGGGTEGTGGSDALPLPASIREATRARLDYLDDESRAVLRVAAVIGRTFTLPVLGSVVGRDSDEVLDVLDAAVTRGTIRESGTVAGSYYFEHILVRDALYRELEPSRRAELHWQVGTALERIHAADAEPHLAELAHHYLLAIGPGRDARRAIDYSTRAGGRAMAQTAYEEAAVHYRRALDTVIASGGDATTRCDLLLALGAARTRSGDTGAGRATYLDAASLARDLGLGDRLASAALGYAGVTGYHFSGRRDETLVALLEEAITAIPPGDSEMRVRLLARLSVALYWSDDDCRRNELSEEAVAMARRLRGPSTLAMAIHSRRYAQWGPDNFEQRLADAALCRTLAFEANELELAVSASRWRFTDLLEDGDVAAADRELDSHAELAQRLHQPFLQALTIQFRAMRAIMQGRFRDGEALAAEARQQSERAGNALAATVFGVQMLPVWFARSEHQQLESFLGTALRSAPPHAATTAATAMIHAELGEHETGAALVEQLTAPGLRKFRHDMLFLPGLAHLATACATLGATSHAEEVYDVLRPYVGRDVVVGAPAQACWGPVDHYLGVLAALAGHDDWAMEHFESALVLASRLGAPALLAETRFELGRLLDHGPQADHDRAAALLVSARRTASALGLQRLLGRIDQLEPTAGESAASTGSGPEAAPVSGDAACSLRRDGDYWTVTTPRGSTHVRDAKGMHHLATLLAQPGRQIHVLDLAAATAGADAPAERLASIADLAEDGVGFVEGFGDAGEVLDDAAKQAYRQRLVELDELIAEAERFNDLGRTSRLSAERDMLVDQLAQAIGFGGRDRRAVSVSERARVNVTRAIRSAIRRIGEHDRAAGDYLDVTVVTGAYCVFEPHRAR
jgi:AAA ATPase-like protein